MGQGASGVEKEVRQALFREALALQATLDTRVEEISAPPLALEQDIDSLILAANNASDLSKPDETVDPKGYRDWLISWVPAAEAAIELSKGVRAQILLGLYDGSLRQALGPDGLGRLFRDERSRLQRERPPGPGLGL